jgi:hypothetical protein
VSWLLGSVLGFLAACLYGLFVLCAFADVERE